MRVIIVCLIFSVYDDGIIGHIVITVTTSFQDKTANLTNKLALLRKVWSCGKCKKLKAQVAALKALLSKKSV